MTKPDTDEAGQDAIKRFRKRQKNYVEKFDKLVTPDLELASEFVGYGVQYGKIAVTFLTLGNAGGLAAILALYPAVKDGNHLWLAQQFWVAVAFTIGLGCGAAVACVAYYNFVMNASVRWSMANNNDLWLKGVDFDLDRTEVAELNKQHNELMAKFGRQVTLAFRLTVGFASVSALAWLIGVWLLGLNLMNIGHAG